MRKIALGSLVVALLATVFCLAALADHKWFIVNEGGAKIEAGLFKACLTVNGGKTECYAFMEGSKCETRGINCDQLNNCDVCGKWNGARGLLILSLLTGFAASVILGFSAFKDDFSIKMCRVAQTLAGFAAFWAFMSAVLFSSAKEDAAKGSDYGPDFGVAIFGGILFVAALVASVVDVSKRIAVLSTGSDVYAPLADNEGQTFTSQQ